MEKLYLAGVGLLAVVIIAVGVIAKPNIVIVSSDKGTVASEEMGIASGATRLTNLEITNELLVDGATTLTGVVTTAGDVVVDDDNSTSTLALGNTGTGKLCLWNGANFTLLSFSSNSTSTSIATSTTCY